MAKDSRQNLKFPDGTTEANLSQNRPKLAIIRYARNAKFGAGGLIFPASHQI